jgi:hypothetical protein
MAATRRSRRADRLTAPTGGYVNVLAGPVFARRRGRADRRAPARAEEVPEAVAETA